MQADALDRLVSAVLAPARFVRAVDRRLELRRDPPSDQVWEVYLGHLLGPGRTRQTRRLASWRLIDAGTESGSDPGGPLVRVHWDADESLLYVVRDVLMHGWTSRESSPGVITTEPAQIWQAELVGTLDLARRAIRAGGEEVDTAEELTRLVELAFVGTSRLPITSVESPASVFAWGEVAYLPENVPGESADAPADSARTPWTEALRRADVSRGESRAARALEFALRAADAGDVVAIADQLARDVSPTTLDRRWRTMFQQVSLAPHTEFLARVTSLLRALSEPRRFGTTFGADLVGYMLRHLVRHLTAYDLVTFHSFGANYPDALWLDALLKLYLEWIAREPAEFLESSAASFASASAADRASLARRLRRRALRQAWLVRTRYEGLPVPDAPTSQGERLRVSPRGEPTVPEEQLVDPARRRKTLFAAEPLADFRRGAVADALELACAELSEPRELLELGTASFVDRPMGVFKDPGEVDRTPFLGYEACSERRAGERLALALSAGLLTTGQCTTARERLAALFRDEVRGVRATELPGEPRAGVIMLEDARLASDDFVIRRTTRGSLATWAELPAGFSPAQREQIRRWAEAPGSRLLVRTAGPAAAARGRPLLTLFDAQMAPTATLRVVPPGADDPVYREAFGVEYLAAGFRLDGSSPT